MSYCCILSKIFKKSSKIAFNCCILLRTIAVFYNSLLKAFFKIVFLGSSRSVNFCMYIISNFLVSMESLSNLAMINFFLRFLAYSYLFYSNHSFFLNLDRALMVGFSNDSFLSIKLSVK